MSCFKEYRDIFGKPGEGAHSYRFVGVAIVDYVMAILAAMFISQVTDAPLVITTIMVLFLGVVMHSAVGISTGATRLLGLDFCV